MRYLMDLLVKKGRENNMMTLDKFEEASEVVKKVTNKTKLVHSAYLSEMTGNKVYLSRTSPKDIH